MKLFIIILVVIILLLTLFVLGSLANNKMKDYDEFYEDLFFVDEEELKQENEIKNKK